MTRFVDSVRSSGLWIDDDSIYGGKQDVETRTAYEKLIENVLSSVVFDIQSVADLMIGGDGIKGWWDSCFSPPFERMVLEYGGSGFTEQTSIFAHCRDVHADFDSPKERMMAVMHWWSSVANGSQSQTGQTPLPKLNDTRWLVTLFMFVRGDGYRTFRAPIARACFALDVDGRPQGDANGDGYAIDTWISELIVRHIYRTDSREASDEHGDHEFAIQVIQADMIQPFLATMALLNTKNITTREVLPTRQQRREAERKNMIPPATYRVLTVRVPGQDRTSSNDRNANDLSTAPLHIVRGHMSRYGPDYGKGRLFGKYDGQFWIPAHVRGTAEAGVILKDYRVEAPKEVA